MPRLTVWMVRAALLQLGIGVTLGMLLLWNKGSIFDGRVWLLLSTHLEMLVFGWLMQLALGVAFWILPRFTQEPRYGNLHLAWLGFVLLNLGIVLVIISAWVSSASNLQTIGRLMELVATILLVIVLWPRVKTVGA